MDLKSFVDGISFSGLDPMDKGILLLSGDAAIGSIADVHLTRLPEKETYYKELLEPVCHVPRMSTFAIGAIINRIVSGLPEGSAYVNVGVWNGFSLLADMAGIPDKRCVGIDNFSEFQGPREPFMERFNARKSPLHEFHDMDYEKYISTVHSGEIGLYFYDGNHAREHQSRGLSVAEPFFSRDCIVLIDDMNIENARNGTVDFLESSKNRYKLIVERYTAHNQHPTYWNGLAILQRVG